MVFKSKILILIWWPDHWMITNSQIFDCPMEFQEDYFSPNLKRKKKNQQKVVKHNKLYLSIRLTEWSLKISDDVKNIPRNIHWVEKMLKWWDGQFEKFKITIGSWKSISDFSVCVQCVSNIYTIYFRTAISNRTK